MSFRKEQFLQKNQGNSFYSFTNIKTAQKEQTSTNNVGIKIPDKSRIRMLLMCPAVECLVFR